MRYLFRLIYGTIAFVVIVAVLSRILLIQNAGGLTKSLALLNSPAILNTMTEQRSKYKFIVEPTIETAKFKENFPEGGLTKSLALLNSPALFNTMTEQRSKYKFVLEPRIETAKFKENFPEERWTSVVIVKSAYGNKDRRDAIRDTWASQKTFGGARFITFFLVGRPSKNNKADSIDAEYQTHEDILMMDVVDTAEHLPDKTLAGMQWVADFLPPNWIYSTADDDMSLNVQNFAKYIDETISKNLRTGKRETMSTLNLPIMCVYSYQKKDPPARDPKSKWYMPKERYPPEYWPPYCRGGWYSMPVELVGKLYAISRWMEYLHLDDVWITGLMRIKYAATFENESTLLSALLDAAPLSLRTDGELNRNTGENTSDVLVSHTWGNIEGRKVNVAHKLRSNWKLWRSHQN